MENHHKFEQYVGRPAEQFTDDQLVSEYKTGMKHTFSKVFGRNAKIAQNLVADELIRRGITEIPNMFGPIQISNKW